MDLLIVTGLSGSGKSITIKMLEDIGFYCVDNVPIELLYNFSNNCLEQNIDNKIAIVCDGRSKDKINNLSQEIEKLKNDKINIKILFLYADEQILVTRYKETRTRHPLINSNNACLISAIKNEIENFQKIKQISDYLIDTSFLTSNMLKQKIKDLFLTIKNNMIINFVSFGFKYGFVSESDLLFDVRCLPNPYYIKELKNMTGLNDNVRDYVLSHKVATDFFDKIKEMLEFLIPLYEIEGKSQLIVAIGCTGGKHRSVTFVEKLKQYFYNSDFNIIATHRDIDKN